MLSELTNIPRVMRSRGWRNAAVLLEKWFNGPPRVAPQYAPPDTTTIRLDTWLLTFPRARRVYDQMLAEKVWVNRAAQSLIASRLATKGLLSAKPSSFGSLGDPVERQHADSINFRAISSGLEFDDLTASLGNCTLHVVASGLVSPIATPPGPASPPRVGRFRVEIQEIGIYMRDSFDFEREQYLGCWSDDPDGFTPVLPPSTSEFEPPAYTPVGNGSFRQWRQAHGRGGDFLIFSDLKRLKLSTADSFIIP